MKRAKIIFLAGLAAAFAAPAFAGVALTQNVESSGVHGAGAFKAESVMEFQGLKARKERTLKFTGSVMRFISGGKGKETLDIDRVDLDKRWALDSKRKTYTESPISVPQNGSPPQGEAAPASSQDAAPSAVRVVKTEFGVKDMSERKTVGEFSAEHYAIRYLLETQDAQTQQTRTYRMEADVWAAPWTADLKQASSEVAAFNKAYFDKMGLGLSSDEAQDFGFKLLALMTGANGQDLSQSLAEFQEKMSRVKGYPVELDVRWYPEQDSAAPAGADDASQDAGSDLSGGASQVAASFLGGLASKMVRNEMAKKEGSGAAAPAFSVRTVVESVKVKSLPESDFEVPAGYRKKA
ncbi:MAG TPA: hypothetical protein VNH15_05310 [Elusimicrobiota bacterium]|nr:hypothetical protein [Elusimicrobiota bacterium]